ncbi:Polarized growth protein rax2 [Escovopsis weberi]|uniref:Polarized growth protein rax2 n=1 Tax=Escovopsis weberi TaxID=150374 RepID=A0A0M9VTY2_ESCWE|nr:Polarized growth protein rax2 [Escovopsis weberi]
MRFLPQRRRTAQKPHPLTSTLATIAVATPILAQAFTFNHVPSPNLDFSNLGRIGIAGQFNGISLYEYEGQTVRPPTTNGSLSLLTELPNGVLSRVAGSDATIRTMCPMKLSNGDQAVVVAGNFTTIAGIKSTAIALFNTVTNKFTPLEGLQGEVNAILCDQANSTVYVGGNFKASNSTNAVAWNVERGWVTLPFAGFNGPVNAITRSADDHVIFGGGFTGLGNVSAPNEPDSQVINLSTARITSSNGATTPGFDDPSSIICSDGSDSPGQTWLVRDGSPGLWEAKFNFAFEPTKLRLWNTRKDGRGTKTWRFVALPMDGIMNFTYVDPATGKNESCTNLCPLSNDPDLEFQDFHFVNVIGMNQFQIAISDWYGAGAGFAAIQLLEDNIFSYAVQEFNEPKCGISFPSSANATGPWKLTPAVVSDSSYMTADLQAPISSSSASITFTPNIRQPGNYSINMYTPGCVQDNSCQTRGQVKITGLMSNGTVKANFSTSLHQTNYFDKYDQIYFGYIDATTENFKPSVTMTPLDGQDISQMTFVAQRIGFTLINATGGLNGLYDFDPSNPVINFASLDDSPVNKLGASFDHASEVTTLATDGDVTYIGGHFAAAGNNSNLIAIKQNETLALNGGLNGQVLSMQLQDNQLFVGGDFTNQHSGGQDGLQHVAVYDTKASRWSALGAGLNGKVEFITPFQVNISNKVEPAMAFSGSFSKCNAFGDFSAVTANGFAVWVLSKQNWLGNIEGSVPGYTGSLTSSLLDVLGGSSLYAGSLSSAELGANGAVTLTNKGLGHFPVKIERLVPKSGSTAQRRAVAASAQGVMPGVATGAFYTENGNNVTILAGHFSAQADGSGIDNLLFIDGKNNNALSGLGEGMSLESSFTTLAFHGSVLYAGGSISGTIDGADVSGIIAFDLASKKFSAHQPAPLSGGNGTVSAIALRPGTAEVYIGGSFAQAGALDCPAVCLYDDGSMQWTRPGNSLGGSAKTLMWYSKTELLAGGDLQANGSDSTYLAIYDAKTQTWQSFPGADKLPGPIDVLTPASSDNSKFWVSGRASSAARSIFIMQYDGKQWQSVDQLPSAGSVIESLQVFTVTKAHEKSDLLADNQVLMLTGSISLPEVGQVSAVLYNGTDYQPYALATGDNNGAGSIAKIFTQKDNFFASEVKHLPLVFVVLIGLAISLGLVVLLVVAGIALDRIRKRREGYLPAPTSIYDRGSGIQKVPPRELLEELGKSRPSDGSAPQI